MKKVPMKKSLRNFFRQFLSICAKCRKCSFSKKGLDKIFTEVFHKGSNLPKKKRLDLSRFSPISTEFSTRDAYFPPYKLVLHRKKKAWSFLPNLYDYSKKNTSKIRPSGGFIPQNGENDGKKWFLVGNDRFFVLLRKKSCHIRRSML